MATDWQESYLIWHRKHCKLFDLSMRNGLVLFTDHLPCRFSEPILGNCIQKIHNIIWNPPWLDSPLLLSSCEVQSAIPSHPDSTRQSKDCICISLCDSFVLTCPFGSWAVTHAVGRHGYSVDQFFWTSDCSTRDLTPSGREAKKLACSFLR